MLIADWFVGSLTKAAVSTGEAPMFSDLKPNPENDFDFTVSTERGPAYLELQEVAPLNGPYEKAQASYKPYYYAQYILMKILEKSNKYPKKESRNGCVPFLQNYARGLTPKLCETTFVSISIQRSFM